MVRLRNPLSSERLILNAFEFDDAGRHYSCTVQQRKGTNGGAWWWFSVSGDMQTYAPFQAVADDTHDSVQARVVEFYTSRLFQLAQPTQRGSHWSRRTPPAKPAPAIAE
ncbi:MAG: hypothetical protein IT353_01170 [Gemmatimonadaceae bacterium]|nr:hypothetical protein [Gemmatimonadaceae bacterium]